MVLPLRLLMPAMMCWDAERPSPCMPVCVQGALKTFFGASVDSSTSYRVEIEASVLPWRGGCRNQWESAPTAEHAGLLAAQGSRTQPVLQPGNRCLRPSNGAGASLPQASTEAPPAHCHLLSCR